MSNAQRTPEHPPEHIARSTTLDPERLLRLAQLRGVRVFTPDRDGSLVPVATPADLARLRDERQRAHAEALSQSW